MTYGSETLVLNGQSDSNGQWVAIDVDDLHDAAIPQTLLDYAASADGVVSIDVSMAAIEEVDTQPYASATASASMGTAITVELAGPTSPVDMDANDAIDINITLSAVDSVNPAHQASLEGTTILWEAFNDSSQDASMSGSETTSGGKIRIASSFENISRIEFSVDAGNRIMFGTTSLTVSLNEYTVPTQNNETNQTEPEWIPTSIQSVTIACESSTILTNQQAANDPIECLVENLNPFAVEVVVSVTESPSLFKTPPGAVNIVANGTATVAFTPKYEDPLWTRQNDAGVENQFSIQLRTSSPDYDIPGEPVLENDVVTWTADLFVEVQTKPDSEEKSSSNVALIGGGVGLAVLAVVGFILYRRASADFDDGSFYEEEEDFIEEVDEPVEIPQGKPLDEFEDKTIRDEPEIIERPSDSLISEVTESADEDSESEAEAEPEDVEEAEAEEEDDGISVDEYGTEWYEDEVGQWWYREEGAEDWSEYNE